jgi:3-hydroxyisobutyrate dehydrogenase-like beta-hydroxyacid dehydrogenase
MKTTFIGFGEAGRTFAGGMLESALPSLRAYDLKIDAPETAAELREACNRLGVNCCATLAEALDGADLVFSLVTAGQAASAADAAALTIRPRTFFYDMNSVAPQTKRLACAGIEAAGGRYVDVAIMAPVRPAALAVPMLVSGPHAAAGALALDQLGFAPQLVGDSIGTASAIKMIRSIMIKGMEALTAECLLAACAAGVTDEVIASLEASDGEWCQRADYNLDRMLVHGLRRAAEMRESVQTAEALGQCGAMAAATAVWQQRLGELRLAPPDGIDAKLRAIRDAAEASVA